MKDGIKSSSIYRILRDGHTAPTMWKHYGCKFMQIAEFDAFTSRIDCIRRMSCHPNSNCFCPFRNRRQRGSSLNLKLSFKTRRWPLHLLTKSPVSELTLHVISYKNCTNIVTFSFKLNANAKINRILKIKNNEFMGQI